MSGLSELPSKNVSSICLPIKIAYSDDASTALTRLNRDNLVPEFELGPNHVPLQAKSSAIPAFLLQVDDSGNGQITARVEKRHEFSGMADFQYQRSATNSSLRTIPTPAFTSEGNLAPLEESFQPKTSLVPARFSPIDTPQDIRLGLKFQRRPTASLSAARLLQITDSVVPPRPSVTIPESDLELFASIQALFQERPIWTKSALCSRVEVTNAQFSRLIYQVAYKYSNGPWRTAYIRDDYDPKTQPEARKYQVADLRTDIAEASTAKRLKLEPSSGLRELVQFQAPPNRNQFIYQLIDITDDVVQSLWLNNEAEMFHERTGWLTIPTPALITAVMKKKLVRWQEARQANKDASLTSIVVSLEDVKPRGKQTNESEKDPEDSEKDAEEEPVVDDGDDMGFLSHLDDSVEPFELFG